MTIFTKGTFKKATIASALAATTIAATATPAMADPYHHRGGDNTAAVAIGAGILGLAVGAIAASSSHHDRYRDEGYYRDSDYYNPGYADWSYRDGYYWDRNGDRHSRDEYARYQRDDHRRGYDRNYGDHRRGY